MKKHEREKKREVDAENANLLGRMIQILKRKSNKDQGLVRIPPTNLFPKSQQASTAGSAYEQSHVSNTQEPVPLNDKGGTAHFFYADPS